MPSLGEEVHRGEALCLIPMAGKNRYIPRQGFGVAADVDYPAGGHFGHGGDALGRAAGAGRGQEDHVRMQALVCGGGHPLGSVGAYKFGVGQFIMPGVGGGEAGDLFLKVHVGARPGFERKGMDVYTSAEIPFTTAVLGGEAVVQTLTGRVVCKINPGTQSGTKIRLKGKGIVSMKDAGRYGDQYVTVQIDVPKNLSNEAKRKLKEFEAACKNGSRGAA